MVYIISELKRLGRGPLLCKIGISRAFHLVCIDQGDYDFLGLHWHGVYIDVSSIQEASRQANVSVFE